MKRILILSSEYAGHGHKSVQMALCDSLAARYAGEVSCDIVNGFALGSAAGLQIEKSYSSIVKYSKSLWKMVYSLATGFGKITSEKTESLIKKRFLELLEKEQYDLIISLHPSFVTSILNIMEKSGKKLPLIVIISDLVVGHRLWTDRRCDLIVCPTPEMKRMIEAQGIPANKVEALGFPVRLPFKAPFERPPIDTGRTLKILVILEAIMAANADRLLKQIFSRPNVHLTVVTGRDEDMYRHFAEGSLPKYADKITLHGYCGNMDELFRENDILLCRGGPNTLMEAVACKLPVIVTGELPGQEEGNADFIHDRGLGIKCFQVSRIGETVGAMLADGGALYNRIALNQAGYAHTRGCERLVERLDEYLFPSCAQDDGI